MQQDKHVKFSNLYFQYQSELTVSLLDLGHAIQRNNDTDLILEYFEKLQLAIAHFLSTDRFQSLRTWFGLDELDLQLLAITYINLLEPETVAPYLQLSWFEQGPTLTLERLLLLTQRGGESKSSNLHNLFLDSNLFKWNMLESQGNQLSLIQPCNIAQDIYAYLLVDSGDNLDSCLDSNLNGNLNSNSALLKVDVIHSPVIALCYSTELNINVKKANVINGLTIEERTVVVREMSFKNSSHYYQVINDSDELLNLQQLISSFRNILLKEKGRICYLYWPDVLKYFNTNYYGQLIKQLMSMPSLRLFFDDIQEAESAGPLNKELFQQYMPDESEWGMISLTLPSNMQKSSAWLAISDVIVKNSANQLRPLSLSDTKLLTNLYPLYPSAMAEVGCRVKANLTGTNSSLFNEFQQACLNVNSKSMGQLASLSIPRFQMQHMVLSDSTKDQLNELIDRIRFSDALKRKIPNFLAGAQALFWGKSGTGKSMAAEAIAGQLKLPLYRVNLANIASKWIGESEKHLAEIFDIAEKQNAVLLFDEADSVFSKRSEVESSHDKNSNMGVSFLLQRMETYTGLLLLSTNFKGNLDDAFLRRFNNTIEFPLPDNAARITLWDNAWKGSFKPSRNIDTSVLAQMFEFSPSQIKNIAERSILYVLTNDKKEITKELLAKAIRRELEKENSSYLAEQKLADWLE
jgi:hypothetical protein